MCCCTSRILCTVLARTAAERGLIFRDRIWLVLAASFVVSIVWFVLAATPYTVPRPHHGVDAEIYVVYVEKRGFNFRETSIAAW
jgi:hypothetical protein